VVNMGRSRVCISYYCILNRMFRKTLTPRNGNNKTISLYAKDLLARMRPGGNFFVLLIFFGRRSSIFLRVPYQVLWLCMVLIL
jgi:hypothetical protein